MHKQKYSIKIMSTNRLGGRSPLELNGTLEIEKNNVKPNHQAALMFAMEFAVNNYSEIKGMRLHINEIN